MMTTVSHPHSGLGQCLALALLLLPATTGMAAVELPAVLSQPAAQSARAVRAATLAVTRAGPRVVAVGEHGIILLSDDSGLTWRQASVPVTVSLTAVHFVDDRNGWAVGHLGVVLHSSDGGETWHKQLDGAIAASLALTSARKLASVEPERDQRAVAEAEQLVADGPDKPFLDVFFRDARTGFVVGAYNLVFRTDDGGKTWEPLLSQVENPDGLHLYGIRALGDDIYIAGEQGLLLKSTDGGHHFSGLVSPYEGSYFGLVTLADGVVIAYGLRGNVFRSEDGGETWASVDAGVGAGITAGAIMTDGALVLVAQSGEVLVSHDAGRSFSPFLPTTGLPLAGAVQAADNSLIVASLAGVRRLAVDQSD